MFGPISVSVTVEIPALSALVTYLQGEQQAQIDAMTTEINALTARLQQSNKGLQAATQQET